MGKQWRWIPVVRLDAWWNLLAYGCKWVCTFLILPPLYFPLFKQWDLQSISSSHHFPSMSPALVLQNGINMWWWAKTSWRCSCLCERRSIWIQEVIWLWIWWESSLSDDSDAAIVKELSDTVLVSSCDPEISAKPMTVSQRQSEAHNCHTNEQPYKCTQCGMAFKRTAGLRNHRRTLCKEAAYVFVKCRDGIPCRQDSFKRKSSLVKHELSHGVRSVAKRVRINTA